VVEKLIGLVLFAIAEDPSEVLLPKLLVLVLR